MLPIKEIEEIVQDKTRNALSIVHCFDHLKRTAIGAKWFVKLLGGNQEDSDKAYLSGILHDIYRPPSEQGHEETLIDDYQDAREILNRFDLNTELIDEITLPIKEHRHLMNNKNILCQSVFLADKLLENMGAMIIFRRNMYLAETPDYEGIELEKATIAQYELRLKKFEPDNFPERFSKLTDYQYAWPVKYLEAYKKKEEWAVHLSEYCFAKGKERAGFEQTVKDFEPKFEKDAEYKEEALQYINGSKFKAFEKLLL
jgi:HD superfamily phosphodiesterase